eukprot:ANDGO_08460.mRNA.1 Kinesin-4
MSEKISFTVFSEFDRKKYKIVLKESDVSRLRVEKIKRNLEKVTGVPVSDQLLLLGDRLITNEQSGADIGLYANCTFVLRRASSASSASSASASLDSSTAGASQSHNHNHNHNHSHGHGQKEEPEKVRVLHVPEPIVVPNSTEFDGHVGHNSNEYGSEAAAAHSHPSSTSVLLNNSSGSLHGSYDATGSYHPHHGHHHHHHHHHPQPQPPQAQQHPQPHNYQNHQSSVNYSMYGDQPSVSQSFSDAESMRYVQPMVLSGPHNSSALLNASSSSSASRASARSASSTSSSSGSAGGGSNVTYSSSVYQPVFVPLSSQPPGSSNSVTAHLSNAADVPPPPRRMPPPPAAAPGSLNTSSSSASSTSGTAHHPFHSSSAGGLHVSSFQTLSTGQYTPAAAPYYSQHASGAWDAERQALLDKFERERMQIISDNDRLRIKLEQAQMQAATAQQPHVSAAVSSPTQQPLVIAQKLHEQISIKANLEAEIRRLQHEIEDSTILHKRAIEDERKMYVKRQETLEAEWNREKQRLLESMQNSNVVDADVADRIRDAIVKAQKEWERDKAALLAHWAEETDILTTIWKDDKTQWDIERQQLLEKHQKECELLRNTLQAQSFSDHSVLLNRVEDYERQVALLRSERVQWRLEAENSQSLVHSARLAIQDVRQQIVDRWENVFSRQLPSDTRTKMVDFLKSQAKQMGIIANSDPNSPVDDFGEELRAEDSEAQKVAFYIVACATAKAKLEERISRLERENTSLVEQLKDESRRRKALHNAIEEAKGNIRVIVRIRPRRMIAHNKYNSLGSDFNMDEEADSAFEYSAQELRADTDSGTIKTTSAALGTRAFHFFSVMDADHTQERVYDQVSPLIQSALDGFPICIFAYGQTGSGKTYTMFGDEALGAASLYAPQRGIIPRAVEDLFSRMHELAHYKPGTVSVGASAPSARSSFLIQCSMAELYLDQVRDMLGSVASTPPFAGAGAFSAAASSSPSSSSLSTSASALLAGLSVHVCTSAHDVLGLMAQGVSRRQVHATAQNPASSRSHLLFFITIEVENHVTNTRLSSKLCFIDLAGSERIAKSHSSGERFKEAQHINKSLSALGDVVAALSENASFVPYRNSKLTLLLQDVLGGSAKTVMVANVAPDPLDMQETLSTLQFASRVKKVRNQVVKNVVMLDEKEPSSAAVLTNNAPLRAAGPTPAPGPPSRGSSSASISSSTPRSQLAAPPSKTSSSSSSSSVNPTTATASSTRPGSARSTTPVSQSRVRRT